MATRIRLSRKGRRHEAIYRVVVADSRSPRDGKFLAQIGFYNPTVEPSEIRFEAEEALKWLSVGAQPSDTVKSLMKRAGVWALFEAKRKGQDLSGMELVTKPEPKKSAKLSPKAQKRVELKKKEEADAAAAAEAAKAEAAAAAEAAKAEAAAAEEAPEA